MKTQIAEMSWHEFSETMRFQDVVIIPVGANAAHGPHSPMGTDAILARGLAERIGQQAQAPVAPLIPVACNRDWASLPGTVDMDPMLVRQVVLEVCESYIPHGARRFFFVNGSEGNGNSLRLVCSDLQLKYDNVLGVQSEWWKTIPQLTGYPCDDRGGLYETSALLAIDESLCDLDLAGDNGGTPTMGNLAFQRGSLHFAGVRVPPFGVTMDRFCTGGCYGDSAKGADKELGEAMIGAYVSHCAALIAELRKIHL